MLSAELSEIENTNDKFECWVTARTTKRVATMNTIVSRLRNSAVRNSQQFLIPDNPKLRQFRSQSQNMTRRFPDSDFFYVAHSTLPPSLVFFLFCVFFLVFFLFCFTYLFFHSFPSFLLFLLSRLCIRFSVVCSCGKPANGGRDVGPPCTTEAWVVGQPKSICRSFVRANASGVRGEGKNGSWSHR